MIYLFNIYCVPGTDLNRKNYKNSEKKAETKKFKTIYKYMHHIFINI